MLPAAWAANAAASNLFPAAYLHAAGGDGAIPVGLEMYSVRDELQKDAPATVRAVAGMGYQGLEFYAPYFEWSEAETKTMRELLDKLGVRCFSTHNDSAYFGPDKLSRARDMNLLLGSKYMVMASSEAEGTGLDKMEASGRNPQPCRGRTGAVRIEGWVSQSPAGVSDSGREAAD